MKPVKDISTNAKSVCSVPGACLLIAGAFLCGLFPAGAEDVFPEHLAPASNLSSRETAGVVETELPGIVSPETRQSLIYNNWMSVLYERSSVSRIAHFQETLASYLEPVHPVQEEAFTEVLAMDSAGVVGEANRLLSTTPDFEKKQFGFAGPLMTWSDFYGRHLTLRELFLHPSVGGVDLSQVLFSNLPASMLVLYLNDPEKAWVGREALRGVYVLLRAIHVLSETPGSLAISPIDAEELVFYLGNLDIVPDQYFHNLLSLAMSLRPASRAANRRSLKNLLWAITRLGRMGLFTEAIDGERDLLDSLNRTVDRYERENARRDSTGRSA
jgi:hypothetical protein